MPRAPRTFKQRDVTAAIKAVVAAGIEVRRVEVERDGRIVVIAGKPELSTAERKDAPNSWEGV
jgi:hypothetical protein